MNFNEFRLQLERCGQTPEEVRSFVYDFTLVLLAHTVRRLNQLEVAAAEPQDEIVLQPLSKWGDPALIAESGVIPQWIADKEEPDRYFLHIDTASAADWSKIEPYLDMAFLSTKQRRLLLPVLSRKRRSGIERISLSRDVRLLNSLLKLAFDSGLTLDRYRRYQAHLQIHGSSQNLGGEIGAAGAAIAIRDALDELAPDCIVDTHGQGLPGEARKPVEIYDHLYRSRSGESGGRISFQQAILLKNGRAIVSSSDPDIAIFQPLGRPYESADSAFRAWKAAKKRTVSPADQIHQFAVGEVKTATDTANLHERLALGSRETRAEVRTDRFLMMAVLTPEILSGAGPRQPFESRDVERFSDVFNLYFAWGYDAAREKHKDHWDIFKDRLGRWCGLSSA